MSEQQADYTAETDEAMQMLGAGYNVRVKDESNDKKYFIITPRIVKAYSRNSHDFALWDTIKDIAGESGECYLNTEQLAILSGISTGQVSNSRKYWIKIGFLKGEVRKDPGYSQAVWHLSIPDLWAKNIQWCEKHLKITDRIAFRKAHKSLHRLNPSIKPSLPEGKPSPSETKKKELKKNSLLDIEGVAPKIEPLTEDEARQLEYDLAAMNFSKATLPYFSEFFRLTNLLPVGKKQLKEWMDACSLLYGAKVLVSDMSAAFDNQEENNFTTKNPGSLMTGMQTIKMRREKKPNGAKHATTPNRQANSAIDPEQLERDRATAERIKARNAARQQASV
jgi:hypothetical protein